MISSPRIATHIVIVEGERAMTFQTDVSEINISYLYGAEAAAVMAACLEEDDEATLDDDTFDDATTVFDRARGVRLEAAPAGAAS